MATKLTRDTADRSPEDGARDSEDVLQDLEALRSERFGTESETRCPTGLTNTIRDMARDFGVSIRTLRFYEDRGLLHPRREDNVRYYSARDRLHLKMILKGKQLGFTLSEIRDILAARGEEAGAFGWLSPQLPPVNSTMFAGTTPYSGEPGSAAFCSAERDMAERELAEMELVELELASIDLAAMDLVMGLRPEQIVAQIEHLERQRRQLDEAILALREAQRRLNGDRSEI